MTPLRAEHFFISTPFIRWTLIPVLLLFAIGVPLMVDEWTLGGALVVIGLSSTAVLYAAALGWPGRLRWAGRAVAAMVFVFYAMYAVDEWFFSETPFRLVESKSVASPRNALLGLVIIGLPALIYALRGRTLPRGTETHDPERRDDA